MVPATGGAPVPLASVNAVGPTNSWPRWCPFAGRYGSQSIYWITFSSERDYGNVIAGAHRPQIWMAAVAPAAGGGDPSFPPFWLPFQDPATGNHSAQWATSIPP